MKLLLVILVIVIVVVLCALFGPDKPKPAAAPAQPATTAAPVPGHFVPPNVQAQPPTSARERGDLSVPVAATGVTTETVNQGPSGATFEAKRRMTDKLQNLSPGSSGGGKSKR